MDTEQDVAHVEYDVINYYTDANPNPNPDTLPTSALPQQRCSRVNNNSNTLLDVVVHSRPARDNLRTVGHQGDPTVSPIATTSDDSNGTSPMRAKGGGSSSSRQRSKGSTAAATPTLGVNMRVTGQCSQGGRKYMEDQFSVAYQESPLTHELEYAFFGIYDGHGGTEAALFAKEHLMLEIVKQKLFWSDNDEDVLRAIREGYIGTHFAMWREQGEWRSQLHIICTGEANNMYVVYINTTVRAIVYRLLANEWLRMEYSIDLPYGYTMNICWQPRCAHM